MYDLLVYIIYRKSLKKAKIDIFTLSETDFTKAEKTGLKKG